MSWIYRLLSGLPPGLLRFLGRLQFRFPAAGGLMARAYDPLRSGEATIRHGRAAGLRFDPSGANPGYALGTTEPAIQEALATFLRPGATFFDIGANVGFFTVLGGKLVGPSGRVFAFEPAPQPAAALLRNVERNGFGMVELIRAAVGRASGEGEFAVAAMGESIGARLVEHGALRGAGSLITVPIVSVDELVSQSSVPVPDLVKLDVEGAEVAALSGMRAVLRDARPVLICETHGTHTEVRGLLESLGYETSFIEPEGEAAWNAHVLALPTPSAPPTGSMSSPSRASAA